MSDPKWGVGLAPEGGWIQLQEEPLLTSGLASFWRLDEASGTRIDSFGSDDLLDLEMGVGQSVGKVGNAAQFVAANKTFLISGANPDIPSGNVSLTIAIWIYFDAFAIKATFPDLVEKGNSASGYEYSLFYDDFTKKFNFVTWTPGGAPANRVVASSFGEAPTGQFIFVVCWHDSVAQTMSIQINNGTADSISKSDITQPTAGIGPLILGAFDPLEPWADFYFDGRMDALGMWDRVLTTQERTLLYNDGKGLNSLEPLRDWQGVGVLSALDHLPFTAGGMVVVS